MVCSHGQGVGGVSQCGHFAEEVVNFSRFSADVLYGRPLTEKSSKN